MNTPCICHFLGKSGCKVSKTASYGCTSFKVQPYVSVCCSSLFYKDDNFISFRFHFIVLLPITPKKLNSVLMKTNKIHLYITGLARKHFNGSLGDSGEKK